ncbi:hypothetical protein Hte_009450 [Hypoxylon texense]
MGKFGSRSIAFRPKPAGSTQVPPKRRTAPFRFLDLPPELRDHIIEIILRDAHEDVLHLFLTCQQIYAATASLFYHHVSIQLRDDIHPLLLGSLTRVSARQNVQNLRIRFTMKESESFLDRLYGTTLREMAEKGSLQQLRIEIGSCFPNDEFWGWDESYGYGDIRIGPGKGQVILAPLFVTKPWFQSFVTFLGDVKALKISLYVDAEDHDNFWCMFHRAHSSGEKCDGWWKGKSQALKIHRSSLVKTLKGATLATPVQKEC